MPQDCKWSFFYRIQNLETILEKRDWQQVTDTVLNRELQQRDGMKKTHVTEIRL